MFKIIFIFGLILTSSILFSNEAFAQGPPENPSEKTLESECEKKQNDFDALFCEAIFALQSLVAGLQEQIDQLSIDLENIELTPGPKGDTGEQGPPGPPGADGGGSSASLTDLENIVYNFDHDSDGFTFNQGDCDDADPITFPGAMEILDTKDNDCDGTIDESSEIDDDGDGYTLDVDCDDTNSAINPDALEILDGIDNNCDGMIDEGFDFTFIQPLDSVDDVGKYNSIAIGNDGLPVISYYDQTNVDLKVAHCSDVSCSSATITNLGNRARVEHTSIAIGSDGFPVISFLDTATFKLKIAHCSDVLCSSATISSPTGFGERSEFTSIAIGTDGFPVISYYHSPNSDLKVAHCSDISCTSAILSLLDTAGVVGSGTSIAIGRDGLPVISYYDTTNRNLKVAHCSDISCASATLSIVDTSEIRGGTTSIAMDNDGLPVISYTSSPDFTLDLKVAHCSDISCTSAILSLVDPAFSVGLYNSIAIGTDGFPVISYYDSRNGDLKVTRFTG